MTPPENPMDGTAAQKDNALAVSLRFETLKQRADFQRAARAKHAAKPGFVLQMRKRKPDETADNVVRVGFTCSKKVGNAVARNRAKRRLREIARLTLRDHALPGHDYVLIGRKGATATLPFVQLQEDLRKALDRLHGGRH